MIKATIVTTFKRYDLDIPAEHAGSVTLAHAWLESQIYGIETEGYIELPGRAIDIRHLDDVRSIEVWEEADAQLLTGAPGLAQIAGLSISDAEPGEYTGEVDYLGQKLQLRLITYQLRSYRYVLPHQVNGDAALDRLDHDKLAQITEQLLQREGISGTVLLPPVQLESDQAAQAYVMDYAEQATPPAYDPAPRTAAAYWGLQNGKL